MPGKLIFVVDDDLDHVFDCKEFLENEGFAVLEAGDGRKALKLLMDEAREPPAVILLDLSMPIMDGWEFLAVVKSYVRLHAIPVILISGYAPTLDPVEHGTIAAYLHKPYDPEEILTLVRKFAGSSAPMVEAAT
jgi:CheY-like chemotaxis protein